MRGGMIVSMQPVNLSEVTREGGAVRAKGLSARLK